MVDVSFLAASVTDYIEKIVVIHMVMGGVEDISMNSCFT